MTEKFQQEIDTFLQTISVASLRALVDDVFRQSFKILLEQTGADAGALWVLESANPDNLTIAVNVGDKGESIEGNVSQTLDSGLVSRAFKENVFVHDEGAFRSSDQSMDVDMQLGQYTTHQMASPFQVFGQPIGALTVIQLSSTKDAQGREWGFSDSASQAFQSWVPVAERLVEYSVVRSS